MLYHITDVGAGSAEGIDSTIRIEKQYAALGHSVRVVSAGHSPLHVAFAACSELSSLARETAEKARMIAGMPALPRIPIALNSAPRNSSVSHPDGQEKYMHRVSFGDGQVFLVYGHQVVAWLLVFMGQEAKIEKIISIAGLIPDTSRGSQFRSGEHLPVVHALEAAGKLGAVAECEEVSADDYITSFGLGVTVAPSDEYGNGRLLVSEEVADNILREEVVRLPDLFDGSLAVRSSLTEVVPGELAIWPSSNFFPNTDAVVLNIGTRWKPGTTRTTDRFVIDLQIKLRELAGKQIGLG